MEVVTYYYLLYIPGYMQLYGYSGLPLLTPVCIQEMISGFGVQVLELQECGMQLEQCQLVRYDQHTGTSGKPFDEPKVSIGYVCVCVCTLFCLTISIFGSKILCVCIIPIYRVYQLYDSEAQDSDSSKTDLHNSVLLSAGRQILALLLGRCFPFVFVYFNFLTSDHMHCIYSQVTIAAILCAVIHY